MTDKRKQMKSGRLMNRIRTQGRVWLLWITVFFVVSVFAGLGVGNFTNWQRGAGAAPGEFFEGGIPEEAKFAAHIGESKVDFFKFQALVDSIRRQQESTSGGTASPITTLEIMSNTIDGVVSEELLRLYGKKNNVTVSDAEVKERVNEFKAQFISAGDDKSEPSTILGEMKRSLQTGEAGEERWREWLVQNNYTDRGFFDEQKSNLALEKARKHLEERVVKMKVAVSEKLIAAIDAELENGRPFEDLARMFSYDYYTRDDGGEIPISISQGFFSEEFDREVFKLKNPGDISPWFKTEFGWERAQLIERTEKEKDKTLDELRDELTAEIRASKIDAKYEPTEEELSEAYENRYASAKVRHITLSESAAVDMAMHLRRLEKSTQILIVHPLVRGYRAMHGLVNEQFEGEEPPLIVKSYIVAEDFQVVEGDVVHTDRLDEAFRLLKGGKRPKDAGWYVPPAEESAEKLKEKLAETGAEAAAETASETELPDLDEGPYVSEPPRFDVESGEPRYEEAILSFEAARDRIFPKLAAPHYYVGWCYETWFADENHKDEITLSEDEVKEIIKASYLKAADLGEFESHYHLALAKFLFEEGDTEGSAKSADKAFEYAGLNKDVLQELRSLYGKLSIPEKIGAVSDKIKTADERERERQAGQPGSMPIQIPAGNGEDGPDFQIQLEDPFESE